MTATCSASKYAGEVVGVASTRERLLKCKSRKSRASTGKAACAVIYEPVFQARVHVDDDTHISGWKVASSELTGDSVHVRPTPGALKASNGTLFFFMDIELTARRFCVHFKPPEIRPSG